MRNISTWKPTYFLMAKKTKTKQSKQKKIYEKYDDDEFK